MSDENGTAPEQDGTEQGGQEPTPAPQPQDDAAATIARLEQQLAEARKEAAKSRVNAKQQAADEAAKAATKQMAEDIGRAIGLLKDGDDTAPDPAQLTAAIGEKDTRIRELSVQLALYDLASKHDASPKALRDSVSFLKSVEGLDPSADDFAAQLDEAIQKAVENNPQLRAGRPPARGAAEFTGGPNPTTAADKAQPGLDRLRAAYAS